MYNTAECLILTNKLYKAFTGLFKGSTQDKEYCSGSKACPTVIIYALRTYDPKKCRYSKSMAMSTKAMNETKSIEMCMRF